MTRQPEPATPGASAEERPGWVVIAFIALVALTPAMPHVALGGIGVDLTDLPTLAAAAVGVVAVVRYRLWRTMAPRRAPEAWALAAIVPFSLIAALLAGSAHSVFAGPARWALNAVLVALAYALLRRPGDGKRMLQAVAGVATFEAAFGLVAYALRWVGPGGYIGISFTGGKIGGMPIWGRITGTTAMAATFIAGFLALALPVAVGLAMAASRGRRWPWAVSSVVIFFGLLFTLSRVPIGLGTLAVVVLLLASTRTRVWLPIVAAGAVLFLATPLRARMTTLSTDRIPLWQDGWRMFTGNWAFGVGPGNYIARLPEYQLPGGQNDMITPHNSLLYVASESGIFAALALAVALALSLRFFVIGGRGRRSPLQLAPMLGVAAFMLNGMTTNLYSIASMAIACWMMAPAVAAIRRGSLAPDEPTTTPGVAEHHTPKEPTS